MPLGGSLDFFPNQFQYISTPSLSANSYDFENVTCFPLSNNQLYPSQLSWLLGFRIQSFSDATIYLHPPFFYHCYSLLSCTRIGIKDQINDAKFKDQNQGIYWILRTNGCVCPGTSQKKHISTLFQYRLKKERERNLRELESERRTRMRKRARSRTTFFLQLLKCFINQPEHIQGKFRIVINLFFSIFMFFPPWYQCFLMMYVQLEIWRRKEWNCECVKVSQTNVTNWTF